MDFFPDFFTLFQSVDVEFALPQVVLERKWGVILLSFESKRTLTESYINTIPERHWPKVKQAGHNMDSLYLNEPRIEPSRNPADRRLAKCINYAISLLELLLSWRNEDNNEIITLTRPQI